MFPGSVRHAHANHFTPSDSSEDELKAGYCVGHRTSSSVFKRKKKIMKYLSAKDNPKH